MSLPANFFSRMDNAKPWLKCGIQGFWGEGKSTTAVRIAIGLAKTIGTDKPVVVANTELSAHFFKEKFAEAHLPEPLVRETESFADLILIMKAMREGLSEILIIDEIFRYHKDFTRGYRMRPTKFDPPQQPRTRLLPEDREILGDEWHELFGRPFINDQYHIIMAGRAGYGYEDERDVETGRIQQYKGSTKMRGDAQLGHLPDLLIEMELIERETPDQGKDVFRRATVKKDRYDLIDGKTFRNPGFEDFVPHIERVLAKPIPRNVLVGGRESVGLFWGEDDRRDYKRNCDKASESIENLLEHAIPGRAAKDLQAKREILYRIFGTHSDQEWKSSKLDDLQAAYPLVQECLISMGYAEWYDERKTIFGVKGLPPVTVNREQIAGGLAHGYEAITPKPLREAHKGLDKIESEVSTEEREDPAEKSARTKRLEQFNALAREMKWSEAAINAYLESEEIPSIEKANKTDYMRLYQGLLNDEKRDRFNQASQCETTSQV